MDRPPAPARCTASPCPRASWRGWSPATTRRARCRPTPAWAGPTLAGPIAEQLPTAIRETAASLLVYRNPPGHTRLRRLVSAASTHGRLEQLAPRVQQIADAQLDALAGEREADLIARYAYPLPMTVICELLGVPEPDRDAFHGWTSTVMAGRFAGVETLVEAYVSMHATSARRAAVTGGR